MNTYPKTYAEIRDDLLEILNRNGIKTTVDDLPELVLLGVDHFVKKKGFAVPSYELESVYLVLSELKQCARSST